MKRVLTGVLLASLTALPSLSTPGEKGAMTFFAKNSKGEVREIGDFFPLSDGTYVVENLDDLIEGVVRDNWQDVTFYMKSQFPGQSGTNGEPDGKIVECAYLDPTSGADTYSTPLTADKVNSLKTMKATLAYGKTNQGGAFVDECRLFFGTTLPAHISQAKPMKMKKHHHKAHKAKAKS